MKTSIIAQPLYHEFIVISPDEPISKYVAYLKLCVKKLIGHFESEFSKAHISLLSYEDLHNDNLLYLIESHISQLAPFELYVKDFAVFKHGDKYTIYIDIPYRWSISKITERLIHKNIIPHITIAKNLTRAECDKVLQMLKSKSISARFSCKYITVLKRTPGNKWKNYLNLWFKSR